MPRAVGNRFTIYDKMEAEGAFSSNPANVHSFDSNGMALYTGPVQYPKMLYHPQGEQRETSPGEWLNTPNGPKLVGQQFELIYQIAKTEEEAQALLAEGWHEHPVDAITARVTGQVERGELPKSALLKLPKKGAESRAKDLQAEIDRLTRQLAERDAADVTKANVLAPAAAAKPVVPTIAKSPASPVPQ